MPSEPQAVARPRCGFLRLRRLLLAGLLGVTVFEGRAMWAPINDDELVRSSDLIVFGRWMGQTALELPSTGGTAPSTVAFGVIAVEQVYKGPAGQGPVLVAVRAQTALRSSEEIAYRAGQRGLWLLRRKPGDASTGSAGLFLADHPHRFVAADNGARLAELKKRLPPPR